MESREPVKGPSFWRKPPEILLFGALSIIFGLLLCIAAVYVSSESSLYYNTSSWPLVFFAGLGTAVSGVGFMAGKSWGYVLSILVYSLAYLETIIQAFQRDYAWGIFLDPVVLSFLLIPRVRSYFLKPLLQPTVAPSLQSDSAIQTIIDNNAPTPPISQSKKRPLIRALLKPSNILTIILIVGLFSIIPAVASQVHAVSVSQVDLQISGYPSGSSESNITSIWFGPANQTVPAASMFTWGLGRMAITFSLTNLGLFQQHTIDWISCATPGFTLYSTGLPVTVPAFGAITFHLVLQAPDYDFSGPVVLQMHTS